MRCVIQADCCLAELNLGDEWLSKPGDLAYRALALAGRLARGPEIPGEDNALLWYRLLTSGSFFSFGGPFRHMPRWHSGMVMVGCPDD